MPNDRNASLDHVILWGMLPWRHLGSVAICAAVGELARRGVGYVCERSGRISDLLKKIFRRLSATHAAVALTQQSFQQIIATILQSSTWVLDGLSHDPAADVIITTNVDVFLIECKSNHA